VITLISKTPVKFRWEDDLAETVVVLQPDDAPEVIVAKLQRVLELEGVQGLPIRQPGAALQAAMAQPQFTPADRAAEEARMAAVQINGWNEDAVEGADELPEFP
jgi:hypothetical protein